MKRFIETIAVMIVSAAIFTLSSFINVLQYYSLSLAGTVILYFISGLALKQYFNEKRIIIPFALVALLLVSSILLLGTPFIFNLLSCVCFMILSFTAGYYFPQLTLLKKAVLGVTIIGAALLCMFYIYPLWAVKGFEKEKSRLVGSSLYELDNTTVLRNGEDMKTELAPYLKNNVVLLEFYFSSCKPCIDKAPVLNRLQKEIGQEKFKTIFINDGRIDKFKNFQARVHNMSIGLYDEDGKLTQALGINAYPFEVLIDKKGVIRYVSEGFGSGIEQEYIKTTTQKIYQLLNE